MQIWLADFTFETTNGFDRTIKNIVTKRIPADHINKHSDFLFRALHEISDTAIKHLVKSKEKQYKVKITYTKYLGQTNGSSMEQSY